MNKQQALNKVKTLHKLYTQGNIATLHQHEVNPGLPNDCRENYIYFTLPVCINFQRNSPAMWAAALKTYQDPDTNYLFFPEKLANTEIDKIRRDLLKHKLALQPNKHTEIWTTISNSLHKHFKDDPREILILGNYDVTKILKILQDSHTHLFPYLRGSKLSNYWLYILSKFTDAKFKNMHKISIIPDTHVIKCTTHLGFVPENASIQEIVGFWEELLKDKEISPVDMHPVLWNWSRANFKPDI